MPHIIETTAFKFEELNDAAKQHAISENYDFNVDHDWWDGVYDDAATIGLKLTGFDLGRGRSITGDFTDSAEDVVKTIKENNGADCNTYKIADAFITELIPIKVTGQLTGDTDTEEEKTEEIIEQFKKDILDAYWKILQTDYDYLTSDKCIQESLIANEYDFDEDGNML